jgi:bacteriorhodopsin
MYQSKLNVADLNLASRMLLSNCEETAGHDVIVWNEQNLTFVASIVVQLLVLVLSFVTIGIAKNLPEVLHTILWMETAVQLIEFLWYFFVAGSFVWGMRLTGRSCEFGVEFRYWDWLLTTPVMLLSLYFLLHYFASEGHCLTNEELTKKTAFWGFVVLIIFADLFMLAIGYAYETERLGATPTNGLRRQAPMALGFVALLCAFIPHFYTIGDTYTDEGIAFLLVTLFLWACYGLVAWYWMGRRGLIPKNAAYNVLDLLSKNAMGIVVSILALSFKSTHGECP